MSSFLFSFCLRKCYGASNKKDDDDDDTKKRKEQSSLAVQPPAIQMETVAVVTTPPIVKKKRFTQADLSFSKVTSGQHVKSASSFGGEDVLVPFSIEDCETCSIFLLSSLAQFTADSCSSLFLFIGPSEGPVFLRNCKNCTVIVACQQLRLRDCQDMKLSLYCKSQPIIETSKGIQVIPFCFSYPGLIEQFEKVQLPIFHNEWSDIYDFNPATGEEKNWKIGKNEEYKLEVPIIPIITNDVENPSPFIQCSIDPLNSVVPITTIPTTTSTTTENIPNISSNNEVVRILVSFAGQVITRKFLSSLEEKGGMTILGTQQQKYKTGGGNDIIFPPPLEEESKKYSSYIAIALTVMEFHEDFKVLPPPLIHWLDLEGGGSSFFRDSPLFSSTS